MSLLFIWRSCLIAVFSHYSTIELFRLHNLPYFFWFDDLNFFSINCHLQSLHLMSSFFSTISFLSYLYVHWLRSSWILCFFNQLFICDCRICLYLHIVIWQGEWPKLVVHTSPHHTYFWLSSATLLSCPIFIQYGRLLQRSDFLLFKLGPHKRWRNIRSSCRVYQKSEFCFEWPDIHGWE